MKNESSKGMSEESQEFDEQLRNELRNIDELEGIYLEETKIKEDMNYELIEEKYFD